MHQVKSIFEGGSIKNLYSSLIVQFRVIIALFLRETRTTFGNSALGYLWAILTPGLGVALLVVLFTLASRQPPFGQSLALFFATGFLTYDFYNKLANSLMTVIDANKALLLYPIVMPISTIAARFLLVTVTYFIIMCAFYGVLIFTDLADIPARPVQLLMAFTTISLLGLGVGMVNMIILSLWDSWRFVWKIINRPFFFISGIFFIPSLLPDYVLSYLKWNPVLHLIEWIRSAYYLNYDSRVLDQVFVVCLSFLLIFIGLIGERTLRHQNN